MKRVFIALLIFIGCKEQEKHAVYKNEIDTRLLNEMSNKIATQAYPNIHSLLISKSGEIVYEEYFEGQDQNFGVDLGSVRHNEASLHDIRSISKSVISALMGICIDQKLVDGVEEPISSFYPEYAFEGFKKDWTIEHFLTMTTGLSWNEKVSYENPDNDEIKMNMAIDPIGYVLTQSMDTICLLYTSPSPRDA